jgi:arylsulfatase A-like enzyme
MIRGAAPSVTRPRVAGLLVCLMLAVLATAAGPLRRPSVQVGGTPARHPNIVVILTDDLGYGDVSAYGATAVHTPNIDRLAREGLRFTDGHAPSAILPGDAALIIDPKRPTLPAVLRGAGYATGIVGKWHLGLGGAGGPDWNHSIVAGPNDVGFESAFIMPATTDRVPTVYVENRRVVSLDPADPITVSYTTPVGDWPTGKDHPELLTLLPSHGHDQTIVNGISRIGYMTGGRAALWKDEDMADVFVRQATGFIEQHRGHPFFLYYAAQEPHVPRVPNPRFVAATTMGPRGDSIVEADWVVGQLLKTLDRLSLADTTLVIFTSDNGPVLDDGYQDRAVELAGDHRPAGPFRGGKYSIFEGGTRVPWIVRWPGHVSRGVSDALVSQVDLLASLAALTGQALPSTPALDSEDVLAALLGQSAIGRRELIEEAGALALREGPWKYIAPNNKAKRNQQTHIELGNDTVPQLYDLAADPGETRNLAASQPQRTTAMAAELDRLQ